ncbi:cold-shock protein [Eubacterium oxidoreducens]|uniref:Cold shock protein (Beta-ribbon, CspA family) n=1 Tax=Eubacterium oxidoreducens TaxID=1732 RepID=A0A1G6B3U3_EUBOX|nr:cold shock domain-containing protein [Eubacterium oxidoreducens]SDB15328.1 cold shock protein (beta-ribbon, CspA family) [Eubacterium oxidoreducens]
MRGTVKWYNAGRGYGFIAGENGTEYFAHHSNIKAEGFRRLRQGHKVEFDVGKDEKGRELAESIVEF